MVFGHSVVQAGVHELRRRACRAPTLIVIDDFRFLRQVVVAACPRHRRQRSSALVHVMRRRSEAFRLRARPPDPEAAGHRRDRREGDDRALDAHAADDVRGRRSAGQNRSTPSAAPRATRCYAARDQAHPDRRQHRHQPHQRDVQHRDLFPTMVLQMTQIGEESGSLDGMLGKVADFYEREVDDAVAALSSLLEPVIIVFLGVVIGGLVVAMYLPIFKLGRRLICRAASRAPAWRPALDLRAPFPAIGGDGAGCCAGADRAPHWAVTHDQRSSHRCASRSSVCASAASLNVVIHRVPKMLERGLAAQAMRGTRGGSRLRKPRLQPRRAALGSAPSCGHTIRPRENVPVLSRGSRCAGDARAARRAHFRLAIRWSKLIGALLAVLRGRALRRHARRHLAACVLLWTLHRADVHRLRYAAPARRPDAAAAVGGAARQHARAAVVPLRDGRDRRGRGLPVAVDASTGCSS